MDDHPENDSDEGAISHRKANTENKLVETTPHKEMDWCSSMTNHDHSTHPIPQKRPVKRKHSASEVRSPTKEIAAQSSMTEKVSQKSPTKSSQPSTKKLKVRRKSSSSSVNSLEDLPPDLRDVLRPLDSHLERVAFIKNLSRRNVKTLLKSFLTNEDVVSIFRATLCGTTNSASEETEENRDGTRGSSGDDNSLLFSKCISLEPRITRSIAQRAHMDVYESMLSSIHTGQRLTSRQKKHLANTILGVKDTSGKKSRNVSSSETNCVATETDLNVTKSKHSLMEDDDDSRDTDYRPEVDPVTVDGLNSGESDDEEDSDSTSSSEDVDSSDEDLDESPAKKSQISSPKLKELKSEEPIAPDTAPIPATIVEQTTPPTLSSSLPSQLSNTSLCIDHVKEEIIVSSTTPTRPKALDKLRTPSRRSSKKKTSASIYSDVSSVSSNRSARSILSSKGGPQLGLCRIQASVPSPCKTPTLKEVDILNDLNVSSEDDLCVEGEIVGKTDIPSESFSKATEKEIPSGFVTLLNDSSMNLSYDYVDSPTLAHRTRSKISLQDIPFSQLELEQLDLEEDFEDCNVEALAKSASETFSMGNEVIAYDVNAMTTYPFEFENHPESHPNDIVQPQPDISTSAIPVPSSSVITGISDVKDTPNVDPEDENYRAFIMSIFQSSDTPQHDNIMETGMISAPEHIHSSQQPGRVNFTNCDTLNIPNNEQIDSYWTEAHTFNQMYPFSTPSGDEDFGDVLDCDDLPGPSDRISITNLSVLDMLEGFFEDDEDEEADPEYKFGPDEVEKAIREDLLDDLRNDRAVQVPKSELKELYRDFRNLRSLGPNEVCYCTKTVLCSYHDPSSAGRFMSSTPMHCAESWSKADDAASFNTSTNTVRESKRGSARVHVKSNSHCFPLPRFSPSEMSHLKQQLSLHVQMLATNILMWQDQLHLAQLVNAQKIYLTELYEFSKRSDQKHHLPLRPHFHSAFLVPNLQPAMEVSALYHGLSNLPFVSGAFSLYNTSPGEEETSGSPTQPIGKEKSISQSSFTRLHLPLALASVFLHCPAFVHPEILPGRYIFYNPNLLTTETFRRRKFCREEDVVHGLACKQFVKNKEVTEAMARVALVGRGEFRNFKSSSSLLISRYSLPIRSTPQITMRRFNVLRYRPQNSLCWKFYQNSDAPMHFRNVFTDIPLRLLDEEKTSERNEFPSPLLSLGERSEEWNLLPIIYQYNLLLTLPESKSALPSCIPRGHFYKTLLTFTFLNKSFWLGMRQSDESELCAEDLWPDWLHTLRAYDVLCEVACHNYYLKLISKSRMGSLLQPGSETEVTLTSKDIAKVKREVSATPIKEKICRKTRMKHQESRPRRHTNKQGQRIRRHKNQSMKKTNNSKDAVKLSLLKKESMFESQPGLLSHEYVKTPWNHRKMQVLWKTALYVSKRALQRCLIQRRWQAMRTNVIARKRANKVQKRVTFEELNISLTPEKPYLPSLQVENYDLEPGEPSPVLDVKPSIPQEAGDAVFNEIKRLSAFRLDSTYLYQWIRELWPKISHETAYHNAPRRSRQTSHSIAQEKQVALVQMKVVKSTIKMKRANDFRNRLRSECAYLKETSLLEGGVIHSWDTDFASRFLTMAQLQLPNERHEQLLRILRQLDIQYDWEATASSYLGSSLTMGQQRLLDAYERMLRLVDGYPCLRADLIQSMTMEQSRRLGVHEEHVKLIKIGDWCRQLHLLRPRGRRFWDNMRTNLRRQWHSENHTQQSVNTADVSARKSNLTDLLLAVGTNESKISRENEVASTLSSECDFIKKDINSLHGLAEPLSAGMEHRLFQLLSGGIGRRAYMQAGMVTLHPCHVPFSHYPDQFEHIDMEREAPFTTIIHEYSQEGAEGPLASEPPPHQCSCSCHFKTDPVVSGSRGSSHLLSHCILCNIRLTKGGTALIMQDSPDWQLEITWPTHFRPRSNLRLAPRRPQPFSGSGVSTANNAPQTSSLHNAHFTGGGSGSHDPSGVTGSLVSPPLTSTNQVHTTGNQNSAARVSQNELLRRVLVHDDPLPPAYALGGTQITVGLHKRPRHLVDTNDFTKQEQIHPHSVTTPSSSSSEHKVKDVISIKENSKEELTQNRSMKTESKSSEPIISRDPTDWRSHTPDDWPLEEDQKLLQHVQQCGYGPNQYADISQQLGRSIEEVKARFKFLVSRYAEMEQEPFHEEDYD